MSSPPKISLIQRYFIIHQKVTYSWADMTPILSFTTIIPLSMENLKKSVTSSVNLDIPLIVKPLPISININLCSL